MDRLKLIIWDMDGTLYQGTLLEGDVKKDDRPLLLIKDAAKHGIVSSICSKNDERKATEFLNELGINDYLVFKSINFEPKGLRVKSIIEKAKLREENVLFVDDNFGNLEEVKYYCPNITALDLIPAVAVIKEQIQKLPLDEGLEKLKQYRILEAKSIDQEKHASNQEFLLDSNIQIEISKAEHEQIKRLYDMLNKTNQLNFTKLRPSLEELTSYIDDSSYECRYVRAKDKYGDYGIIGFYILKENKLLEFAFSCRVLGMGIEQYVFSKLSYPEITIKGPCAVELKRSDEVTWIKETSYSSKDEQKTSNKTLALYGGCPLRPIHIYINSLVKGSHIYDFEPDPSILNLSLINKYDSLLLREFAKLGTLDYDAFSQEIFAFKYLLISLAIEPYCYRFSDTRGRYFYAEDREIPGFVKEPVSYEMIKEGLSELVSSLKNTKLIVLLSSEVVFSSDGKDKHYQNRIETNKIARELSAHHPEKVMLLDLNKYAKSESDFFNSWGNHYLREIGYELALELKEICADKSIVSQETKKIEQFDDLVVETNIENGVFKATCNKDVTLSLLRNNKAIYSSKKELTYQLREYGCYQIMVLNHKTSCFVYDELSHYIYLQEGAKKEEYLADLKVKSKDDLYRRSVVNHVISIITILSASGLNINDILVKHGFNKISLFVDENIDRIITPYLVSDQRINIINHYCDTRYLGNVIGFGNAPFLYRDLEDIIEPQEDEALLFCQLQKKNYYKKNIRRKGHQIIYLPNLLEEEMTNLFVKRVKENNIPLSLVVKLPRLSQFRGFDKQFFTSEERHIYNQEWPLISFPRKYLDGLVVLEDYSSQSFNISNGQRLIQTDKKNAPTVFLFGSPYLLGDQVKDDETIAAKLNKISHYNIECLASSFDEKEYRFAMNNLFNVKYRQGDKAVLFLSNTLPEDELDRDYYLSANKMKEKVPVIDMGIYLFIENRESIYVSPYSYTPAFSEIIAQEIKKKLGI